MDNADNAPKETQAERLTRLKAAPGTMIEIFGHLANGGSLINLCQMWSVRYSDIIYWINEDAARKKLYTEALIAQQEWSINRLLQELRAISFVDIKQIFNEDHSLKPPSEWPDDVAAALAGIEVDEIWEMQESENSRKMKKVQIGETKKVKLFDKLKALEMLGRDLGRFTQKIEHSGKLTLEDLVSASIRKTDTK